MRKSLSAKKQTAIDTEEALRRSEARFRLLSEAAGLLLKSENPQGIVNELCRGVMEYLDCQAFFNFLVDKPSGRLRLNACAGIPDEEARRIGWLEYGVAVCGCVARDGKRIIAEDIANTYDIRTELVSSYGIQAYCCHPLMAQGELIGTLSFGTTTRPRFSADDIELMRIVADQVAVAMQRILDRKALEESEKKYRTLFEEAPFPVFEWDFSAAKTCLDGLQEDERMKLVSSFLEEPGMAGQCINLGRAVQMNKRGLDLFGVTSVNAYNMNLEALTSQSSMNLGSYLFPLIQGTMQGDREVIAATSRGEKRTILLRWNTLPGYEETLDKVLVSAIDITDQKALESELRKKNLELEDFIHHLSHSMRNGLLVIKRWGEIYQMSPELVTEKALPLVQNAQSLINTIDGFLKLLMVGKAMTSLEEINLERLTREIFDAARSQEFQAELIYTGEAGECRCDPAQMKEIFLALIRNSFTYRNPLAEVLTVTITASRQGKSLRICYRDNGRGMTNDTLERLFHIWFSPERKEPRGLKLSIVKKLVDHSGGTITAHSEGPGRGTEFILSLPAEGHAP